MEIEQWKEIKGFNYEVSSLGNVRRSKIDSKYSNSRIGKVLKPWKSGKYLAITLIRDGKQYAFTIHRLVMEVFIGPRPPGLDIHHINEDPHDNRLLNLGYTSRSANMLAMSSRPGPTSRFSMKDIQKIKFARNNLSGKKLSKIFKCSEATIIRVIQGKYDYLLENGDN